jgi:RES domain-containing protein
MILFRFSPKHFSGDISGEGARQRGGRWNSVGLPVVYTSTTISLSLLELLIYNAAYTEMQNNYLMKIEVPGLLLTGMTKMNVKQNWQKDIEYTRFIGDSFLTAKKSLLLKVPSAIIPDEYNILINPLHPDCKKVKIIKAAPFQFDARLFK